MAAPLLCIFNRANTLFPLSHLSETATWMRFGHFFFLSPVDCWSITLMCMSSFYSILDSTKLEYLGKVKGSLAPGNRFSCPWQDRQWLNSPFYCIWILWCLHEAGVREELESGPLFYIPRSPFSPLQNHRYSSCCVCAELQVEPSGRIVSHPHNTTCYLKNKATELQYNTVQQWHNTRQVQSMENINS